jgi:phosphatidylserine/phosphatidylglycerophosphate/cardiolipin synthase-like enzyme
MKLKTILSDYYKIKLELYDYIINAKTSIYINSWMIDLNIEIYENIKLYELLNQKHNEEVKVTITMFNNPLDNINNSDKCNFEYITTNTIGESFLPFLPNYFSELFNINQQCIHQKYILIDEKYLFLNGSDMNDKRDGSISSMVPNKYKFIWYETCVIIEIDLTLANMLISYYYNEKKTYQGLIYTKNKCTLFTTALHDCQCNIQNCFCKNIQLIKNKELIDQAKKTIYIEQQYFDYSFNNNDFIDHLIYLLIKNPKLTVTVLTNIEFSDVNNQIILDGLLCCVYLTLKKIKIKLKKFNLVDRFKIKYLEGVFIHSKFIVIDKDVVLVTTSNLSDRSLLNKCDLEMSLILENKEDVDKFIYYIEQTHSVNYNDITSANDKKFLDAFNFFETINPSEIESKITYLNWLHKLNNNRFIL